MNPRNVVILLLLGAGVLLIFFGVAVLAQSTVSSAADRNYISIYPDHFNTNPNQQANLSWNFTTWDNIRYPDCYIAIYGDMHSCTPDFPFSTCPLKIKIVNPLTTNKTVNGFKFTLPARLKADSTYYINLQCYGTTSYAGMYESVNLDIAAFSTKTGFNRVADTDYCEKLPGTNCEAWREVVSQGRTWTELRK